MNSGASNVVAVCICIALATLALYAVRVFAKSLSQGTVASQQVRVLNGSDLSDHDHSVCIANARRTQRNHLAANAMNGLLACPPGPNDQAKDRSPEAIAELAVLYANELISLEDVPVRSSAEVKSEARAFRSAMMEACGGQCLTLSQLEMLEALSPDARLVKCAELRAQWEIDRVKLRDEIAKENEETAARIARGEEALNRAKEIRAKRASEVHPS